jgi:uncharacterized protein
MNQHAQMTQQQTLRFFVQQLHGQLGAHLRKVILFGSRDRGDARADSDDDCLAVVDRVSPPMLDTIDELAGQFLCDYQMVFSVLSISEERYATHRLNPFLMNVRKEGIAV